MSGVSSVKEFGLGVRVRTRMSQRYGPTPSYAAAAAVDKGMQDRAVWPSSAGMTVYIEPRAPDCMTAAMLKARPSPAG